MKIISTPKKLPFIKTYFNKELKQLIPSNHVMVLLDEHKKLFYKFDNSESTFDFNSFEKAVATEHIPKSVGGWTLCVQRFEVITRRKYYMALCIKEPYPIAKSFCDLLQLLAKEAVDANINRLIINNNEQFTFAIMNSTHFGVMAVNSKGEIIYANDHACRTVNIRRRDLLKIPVQDLVTRWDYAVQAIQDGEIIHNDDWVFTTPEDSIRFNVSISAINNAKQNQIGYVITFRLIEKVYQLVNKYTGMQARYSFDDIIGKSKMLMQTVAYAKTISNSPSTILIEGESGTGKEVFAQSIHNASNRKHNSFVAINCAALPENLIESELFGYDDGAYTGAKKGGHPGKFELANHGTIFLDEIGDMELNMQVKLLRAIQESSVTRIGGDKNIPIDVRIIAATNKNLLEEVGKGNFRMDLFYRLSVIPLRIPSLRERKDDIPVLIRLFLNQKSAMLHKDMPMLEYDALQKLLDYDWPGNVRELENYVEQLVNFGGDISLDSFKNIKAKKQPHTEDLVTQQTQLNLPLAEMEKHYILSVLKANNNNMSKTATILNISRNTLYLKVKKYTKA